MSALMAWRAKNKEAVAKMHDVRLGYMGAFTKATSLAAQRVPQINASIDTDRGFITYRDYVDISIAVSTPKGLVTPVIRDCETKSIVEIERAVGLVAQKASIFLSPISTQIMPPLLTALSIGTREQVDHGRSPGWKFLHQ